ncbi:TssN family type VI secretion system protein [Capnocytophaga cynodegmi]|uniref:TssN family type VI secretion system protein n=1 Tax=Capnocytophaga cynodegmi TaxID=28189 RepID=UPI00385BCF1C
MNTFLQKLITSQLLIPIITVLLGIVVIFIAKKNQLLSDKKAVFYVLLSSVILSSLGLLGYLQVDFMPYAYIALQVFYLIMGYFNYRLYDVYIKALKGSPFWKKFLVLLIQILISGALFSLIFNLVNDFKYGIWASTCLVSLFIAPFFMQTFQSYLNIPIEIYKMKIYDGTNKGTPIVPIDTGALLVYEIEVYKTTTDEKPTRLKAKSTKEMILGDWFELILSDYNQRKFSAPIEYYNLEEPYGWVFYTKPSFFLPRKYIDPDMSFQENKLSEKQLIIAKRVREQKKVINDDVLL